MKSILLNKLLFPIWLALIVSIGCIYFSFEYDALADFKEAKFKSVEKQLLAVDCKGINPDVLISVSRQTFEDPRERAKLLRSFSFFLLALSFLFYFNVRNYLKVQNE